MIGFWLPADTWHYGFSNEINVAIIICWLLEKGRAKYGNVYPPTSLWKFQFLPKIEVTFKNHALTKRMYFFWITTSLIYIHSFILACTTFYCQKFHFKGRGRGNIWTYFPIKALVGFIVLCNSIENYVNLEALYEAFLKGKKSTATYVS